MRRRTLAAVVDGRDRAEAVAEGRIGVGDLVPFLDDPADAVLRVVVERPGPADRETAVPVVDDRAIAFVDPESVRDGRRPLLDLLEVVELRAVGPGGTRGGGTAGLVVATHEPLAGGIEAIGAREL